MYVPYVYFYVYRLLGGGGGGLRVKIGHHKIGACAEKGQNRIRGGWGVKNCQKSSDIIYVRSLIVLEDSKIYSIDICLV